MSESRHPRINGVPYGWIGKIDPERISEERVRSRSIPQTDISHDAEGLSDLMVAKYMDGRLSPAARLQFVQGKIEQARAVAEGEFSEATVLIPEPLRLPSVVRITPSAWNELSGTLGRASASALLNSEDDPLSEEDPQAVVSLRRRMDPASDPSFKGTSMRRTSAFSFAERESVRRDSAPSPEERLRMGRKQEIPLLGDIKDRLLHKIERNRTEPATSAVHISVTETNVDDIVASPNFETIIREWVLL